ncbi:hypothetical protein ACFE04_021742 [Oxalis oulophora]
MWGNYNAKFCIFPSTSHVSVTFHDNSVTKLKIIGYKVTKAHKDFNGFAVFDNLTLSASFSIDSFITTLIRLTSLKYLNLVSLGIWGNLSDKNHRLVLPEFFDLSSNYFLVVSRLKCSQLPNMPKGLGTILLSKNSFSIETSHKFGNLGQLQHLDVSFNDLSGAPPSILLSLPNISYLNLASNINWRKIFVVATHLGLLIFLVTE